MKHHHNSSPTYSVALAGCSTVNPTWSNVVTEPVLPVQHGAQITLSCDDGYTNKGGDKATCQNGQVTPTTKPPDFQGETAIKFPKPPLHFSVL